jgi:hypothetical protein
MFADRFRDNIPSTYLPFSSIIPSNVIHVTSWRLEMLSACYPTSCCATEGALKLPPVSRCNKKHHDFLSGCKYLSSDLPNCLDVSSFAVHVCSSSEEFTAFFFLVYYEVQSVNSLFVLIRFDFCYLPCHPLAELLKFL